ncbi:hypothetical protein COHA_008213 [Chlorella ohadii]|uniref:Uncharacterized protein n=1 Tax=Chlorella ohadii TaxID=2649997 RepID=A0AAD5DHY8_9CHLO|nr:hypothetical protein COHA_008213 [Chlorella ohadii]
MPAVCPKCSSQCAKNAWLDLQVFVNERTARRSAKRMVWALLAALALLLVVLAANAGLTFAVLTLSKDTKIEQNVLVAKDSGRAIQTGLALAPHQLMDMLWLTPNNGTVYAIQLPLQGGEPGFVWHQWVAGVEVRRGARTTVYTMAGAVLTVTPQGITFSSTALPGQAVCSGPCAARAVPQRAAKTVRSGRRAIGGGSVAAVIGTKACHSRAARAAARTAAVGGGGGDSGGEVEFCVLSERSGGMAAVPGVKLDKTAADRGTERGRTLVQPDEVVIHESSIQVLIDYPLRRSTVVTLHGDVPSGFIRRHLLESLQAEYSRIYADEEAASPVPNRSGRVLFNRPNTSGPWGIWGHDQSNLQLCSMTKLEREGVWVLSIGS